MTHPDHILPQPAEMTNQDHILLQLAQMTHPDHILHQPAQMTHPDYLYSLCPLFFNLLFLKKNFSSGPPCIFLIYG